MSGERELPRSPAPPLPRFPAHTTISMLFVRAIRSKWEVSDHASMMVHALTVSANVPMPALRAIHVPSKPLRLRGGWGGRRGRGGCWGGSRGGGGALGGVGGRGGAGGGGGARGGDGGWLGGGGRAGGAGGDGEGGGGGGRRLL